MTAPSDKGAGVRTQILAYLRKHGPSPASVLAEAIGEHVGAVSRQVSWLLKNTNDIMVELRVMESGARVRYYKLVEKRVGLFGL